MADAKLEIKAGLVAFTGEGTEGWLAEQLDKVLIKLSELRQLGEDLSKPDSNGIEETKDKPRSTIKIGPLATYLKEKKATSNQARKFLATAAWLQLGGIKRVSTAEVTQNLNAQPGEIK